MKKPRREWDAKSLVEERSYGFFWYDWIWRFIRPIAIFGCAVLLLIGVAVTAWQILNRAYLDPIAPLDDTPIAFVIESGSSLTSVAQQLENQGLIRNHSVLKYWMDFQGMSQKVQAGSYMLSRAMTLSEIIDQLTTGDGKPLTRNITVIPGWTIERIASQFKQDGVITDSEAFLTACREGTEFNDFESVSTVLASLRAKERIYILEGYLAPDTYEIYTNASMNDIIRKLIMQTETIFNATYQERAKELGMTMDQVFALASIVEKEAKQNDFAKVSAVFHNRLNRNMTLSSDPTLKYVSRSEKVVLGYDELQVKSPYNTYNNGGLPIGPICNPSKAAVEAALYPDEEYIKDGYLFFCSKDIESGEIYFSKTLAEHETAVEQYLPSWQEYDRKRGL